MAGNKTIQVYRHYLWLLCLLMSLLSGGCLSREKTPEGAPQRVTVQNYTFTAAPHAVSVAAVPQRIVVCGGNAADTLLALGMGPQIHTLVLTEPEMEEHFQNLLPQADVRTTSLTKEALLVIRPDFILGMRRFFSEQAMGDTVFWERQGVAAYIQDASGPIPALENFPPCTIDSEKTFLLNMGKIFAKEDSAQAMVAAIDAELQKKPTAAEKKRVLVVEFLHNTIEVFGAPLLSGDIVSRLGGEIISYETPFISMEELLTVQADVIFVVYHGTEAGKEAALAKFAAGPLAKLAAVRNGQLYPLPFDRIVATGVHTPETIRRIREGMYPEPRAADKGQGK